MARCRQPRGKVAVEWQVRANPGKPHVILQWAERGGPSTAPPTHEGHGVRFIERSTIYELRGKATLELGDGGLRAVIDFPLPDRSDGAQSSGRSR